jgi:dihydroflavonol-4-reductase
MIAVTGANGLLGSYIIRELLERKESFIALKRKGSDISLLNDVNEKITWHDADINDSVVLDETFQNVTQVIHAAAVVSFNPRLAKKIYEVNVQGTRNVVNACLSNNVKRIVHISSVAALGRVKAQTNVDESNKWVDSSLNSVYAESKYLAELEIFRAQEENISTVILNPSVILAGADWTKSSAQLFKYVWDQRPYYINGSLNYVDVRDVANAACTLLHTEHAAQRFIISAGDISFQKFFETVAVQFGKKAPRIRLNKSFLTFASHLERMRALFHKSEPLITRETARLAETYFCYQNEKIKKAINFQFKSIDETIQWCCRFYLGKFNAEK